MVTNGPVVDERTTPRSTWGRTVGAVLCLVLAAVLTTPAAIAYWGQRTLNDGQRYVATVGPLVQAPQVQEVLAETVTDAIQQQVDVDALLEEAFASVSDRAPRLQLLVGPLSAAIDSAVERQVRSFLASDAFAEIWTRVNTRAQQALQRVLEGRDGGAVSLQGDDVVLDVSEVVDQVKQRLADRGMTFVENVPVPQTSREIVLMEAPRVKQMRTIYAFADPVARWLLPVVGVLYLAAYVLARRRAPMAVAIGAVVAVNALLLALLLSVGGQLFDTELSGTRFGPASTVFYETMIAYLQRAREVVLWLGLTLVVAGWFAGDNRSGTAVRTTVARGLERAGAALPAAQLAGPGTWVAANVRWLRVVVAVLAGVVLLWGNEATPERWWWSLALAVVLLAVLQVLVGAGRAGSGTDARRPGPTVPVGAT